MTDETQKQTDQQAATFVLDGEEVKPYGCATWFVKHPYGTPIVIFLLWMFATGILVGGGLLAITENGDQDFAVHTNPIVKDWFALQRAEDFVVVGDGLVVQAVRSSEESDWNLIVLYKGNAGNMLTLDNIARMRTVEQFILNDPEYNFFCFAGQQTPNCSDDAYLSLALETLPGTSIPMPGSATTQGQLDAIVAAHAAEIAAGSDLGVQLQFFYDTMFSASSPTSEFTRSILRFGGPLGDDGTGSPYVNVADRSDDQRQKFADFTRRIVDFIDEGPAQTRDVEVLAFSVIVFQVLFEDVIFSDLLWSAGAMMFVFFYISFHTRSLFLGTLGVWGILMSFPLGFFVYRVILQLEFFQALQILSIFIVLGVGADDIFVFVDAWNQAGSFPQLKNNLELRMAYTHRRAARTMLVTTFTTAAAFLATGVSSIIPIATFGFFAACLITMNYILVITFFPCIVVIWHTKIRFRFKYSKCCPCLPCCQDTVQPASKQPIELTNASVQSSSTAQIDPELGDKRHQREASVASYTAHQEDLRAVEKFFLNTWAPAIHRGRYVIVVVVTALIAVSLYFGTTIPALSEQEQFFPDEHFLRRSLDTTRNQFVQSEFDTLLTVTLVWGVAGIDQSNRARYDPNDLGEVVFDDTFDLSVASSQQHILDVCGNLEASGLVLNGTNVRCFMADFRQWRIDNGDAFPAVYSADPAIQRANFTAELQQFADEFLLSDRVDYISSFDIGIDPNGVLRFVTISGAATLRPFQPRSQTLPVYNRWQQFITDQNTLAPSAAINKGYQTAREFWSQFVTEKELVDNAIRGMGLSLGVAFIVLVLSTTNIIVALFAIFSIFGIVGFVTVTMVLQGWELGISQSVALVVLIGFSVDYVVHIGNSYMESTRPTRSEKVEDAVVLMGISVLAGALTTFGASLFLWGGVILFFNVFAVILSSTVAFALFFALVYFTALLDSFGPEGEFGSILPFFRWCRGLCKKKE